MRSLITIQVIAFGVLFGLFVSQSQALGHTGETIAQDRVNSLKLQLEDVKARQGQLQEKLEALDEQLKPENLENSLAGVGSTHPEDLRELKRKQLEKEKTGVEKQLALLNDTQTRLESSIAQAEADAYHQSARAKRTSEATEDSRSPKSAVRSDAATTDTPQVRSRRSGKTKARSRRPRQQH